MKHKHILLFLIAAGVLASSGYGLYRLGIAQGIQASSAPASASAGSVTGDKKVLYWHDPMVPAQKFDKPGKSPFMDMQLVPVYADEGDDSAISISPRVQQNLGIRTAEVTKGKLSSAIVAVGSVAYNERDVALVQARSNGFIEKLYVRAPLDPVKKGQVLAELYVPDWVAAQEEFLTVKRMPSSVISGLLDGAKQRMRLAGMSDEQIQLVEVSGKLYPRIAITAPISGVIAELSAREGSTVMTGAPLFRINGLSSIWVNADIPESLSAQVRTGIAVEARTPSLPGTVFKGKLSAILPQVDLTTRTLKARVELTNPGGQLVPGMFATLSFSTDSGKEVLLIPTEAIIQTGTRSVVMVMQSEGHYLPVTIEAGQEAHGQTEIRNGLESGQKVVISGQFLIDSEASLKGTATRMGDVPSNPIPAMETKVPANIHHGNGKVEKISKDVITLSHGPMMSLQWEAMTMDFVLPATGLPRNIAVGDNVNFDISEIKSGTYQIVAISPLADAAAPAAKNTTAIPSAESKKSSRGKK
ncbi:efflux RND transporter periplasmic adaptor subunit [Undibacterium sp. RuTC16W]|uniref:efflux RND transporter periplasmic adaptor subunit n=1 Tax=Undibacterium sp. RuTC16W TaxID=3413048 RepID=UPI003BF364F9